MTIGEAISSLNLATDMIPGGSSNRPGTRLHLSHITIHNTDNPGQGADAQAHARYVKGPDARARKVSWHYTADDVRVIQHLPDDEVAWHAGSGNTKSLAIEICMHAGIDQAAADDRAALLVAVLMKRHGLRISSVVPHNFWTGKHCPRLLLDSHGGFQGFINLVSDRASQIDDASSVRSISHEFSGFGNSRLTQPCGSVDRVRVLEELLGRAVADIELTRRQLEATRNEQYETL